MRLSVVCTINGVLVSYNYPHAPLTQLHFLLYSKQFRKQRSRARLQVRKMTTQPIPDPMRQSVVFYYSGRCRSRSTPRPFSPTNVLYSCGCIQLFGCLLVHRPLSNIPTRIHWQNFMVSCFCPLLWHSQLMPCSNVSTFTCQNGCQCM